MVEDVGVGGMLDNDIPESRLREATLAAGAGQSQAGADADVTSAPDQPDTSGRDEKGPTCVRSVLIGMRELCRRNGINEALTACLVGRVALGFCDIDPPV